MTDDFLPVFENKLKFNHNPKLPAIFRMTIVGKSGSGKSVLANKILLIPSFVDYNRLYIYSKMIKTQPEVEAICYAFNKNLTKETIIELFRKNIPPNEINDYIDEISIQLNLPQSVKATCTSELTHMINENDFDETKKNLVVIDDFQNDAKVNELAESLFNNARKKNVNLIYIAQRYSSIPKMVRANINFVITFLQSKRDADMFYSDILSPFMDKKDFKRLIDNTWAKNFNYIAVNLNTGKIYLNLFE